MISRETGLATLLFTALTIALAYPLTFHPATLRFPTGPDGDLAWYLLAWNTHALVRHPWSIFEANIYYPARLTLAFSENFIGLAFFAAPVIWLTGNLALAANFVSIMSSVLCGLGAYLLARRLRLSVAAALLAGIIFECAPPRFFRIGQLFLSSVQWIPLALAALHAYFDGEGKTYLRLAAACVSLQALSSGHGAVFIGVTLLVFAVVRLLLGEPIRPIRWLKDLGVPGGLLLLPVVLIFLPYLAVQRDVGLKRGLGGWGVNYQSFLASPSHLHAFLRPYVTDVDVNATASSFLFPGYLALLLAAAAFAWRLRCSANDPPRSARLAHGSGRRVGIAASLACAIAVAGVLTGGTLIPSGIARLVDTRSALVSWAICACLAILALAVGERLPSRGRRPLFVLLGAAAGWCLLVTVRPVIPAGNGLVAEYFANPTSQGAPILSAAGDAPSMAGVLTRWPGPVPNEFSMRWRGFLTVGRPGRYTFATTSDDGSLLFVRNQLVVDNGGAHERQTRTGTIDLDRGSHAILLTYTQYGADAALDWSWSRDGTDQAPVPAWILSQQRTRYATAIAARGVDWIVPVLAILAAVAGLWSACAILSRRVPLTTWLEMGRRDPRVFYAVLVAAAVALALGPPYGLWQYVYSIPPFNFIRESSRFMLVGLLGVAVLAAIGFDRVTRGVAHRTRLLLATITGAVLVAEYAAMPMAVQVAQLDIPAIDRWLDTQPKPFVVAEVPVESPGQYGAAEWRQATYMIHSTAHWQKTVHGYSGWRTDRHHQLYADMYRFPDDTSLNSLSDLGVTYVVVHTDLYPPGEWPKVEARLRQSESRLRLVHVEGHGRVYALQGG